MANVLIDKDKLDVLANAISAKSGEPLTLTLDEMVDAVDGIDSSGGGTPTLETVTITYTAITSTQTDTIIPSAGYDGIDEVDVTIDAIPLADYDVMSPGYTYATESGNRKFKVRSAVGVDFPGWIPDGNKYGNYISFNAIPTGTTITPSTSSQTIGGSNYMMEGAVTVSAMPSGTEGTPTASKGTVTNHSVTVTPSVTNSAGYISGGTHTGTGVSVSASELVSGNVNLTAGTTDVTNYATATVASGSATPASTITASSATISTSSGTITLTKTNVSSTPQVTAGYISSGTQGTSTVTLSAPVTLQAAATYYPSTSDQTITSPKYLTGTQTIKAVTYANITAENIKNGVTVTIGDSSDADRVLSVTGTYTGGGGSSKNVQMVLARYETNSSSYTATSATITVSKAGTYKCSWTMDRNTTSGTNGTRLYKGTTAQGTAHTTWTHNGSFCQETLTCAANDTLTIYARARSTSYYVGVGNFIIEEQ